MKIRDPSAHLGKKKNRGKKERKREKREKEINFQKGKQEKIGERRRKRRKVFFLNVDFLNKAHRLHSAH